MKPGILILAVPLLVACAPAIQQQAPRPAPRPVALIPRPTAQPAPTPSSTTLAAWADAPLTPGRWTYQPARGAGSRALFGLASAPSFQVACGAGRVLILTRSAASAGAITVRTSSTARTLPGVRSAQGLSVQLPANDPLMDAIAFSRGRFAVEAPGVAPLVIPAWPELARVVEDCRR